MSVSLINFFREHQLPQDFCIYYNTDDVLEEYSPVYENYNSYKYYIPLQTPFRGYHRIVVSTNAEKYIEAHLGTVELDRLRVAFFPWPEIVLMSQENHRNGIHDEMDSIEDVMIRFDFKGDFIYERSVPTYESLNFLGIKQCRNFQKEYPKGYNLNVMTKVKELVNQIKSGEIPPEAILFKKRKERLRYKLGNAEFIYDLSKLQHTEISNFIEQLPRQDLLWLENHRFKIVIDFSGSKSGIPFLMYKIILAENENEERVVLYRSGVSCAHPSIRIEKRTNSIFPEIGIVWEQQDGHDYWGGIKKVFEELGDRFVPIKIQ